MQDDSVGHNIKEKQKQVGQTVTQCKTSMEGVSFIFVATAVKSMLQLQFIW